MMSAYRRALITVAALAVAVNLAYAAVGFKVDTGNFQTSVVDSQTVVVLEFYSPRHANEDPYIELTAPLTLVAR